jgi:hypothetical protein
LYIIIKRLTIYLVMKTLVGLLKTATPMVYHDYSVIWSIWEKKIDFFSFLMACKQMLRKWSSLVSNATFNNISVISWRSVLLVEETRGSVENNLNGWWQLIMKERYMMNDCWTFREQCLSYIEDNNKFNNIGGRGGITGAMIATG